jgi:hypothetical protein
MTIEWGGLNLQSNTVCQVLDPGDAPTTVLDANVAFRVRVIWTVPPGLAPFLGGQFRLRCFAESVGPGQEQQIGGTELVPVVPGQTNYSRDMTVGANALQGEGVNDPVTGQPVSGMYRIATVIQHLNGGPTMGSGFAADALIQMRQP